jgi:predicted transcriptional regulator
MKSHRTLYIGIAPRSYLKARTIAVARGEKPYPDEPKHWVSSVESLGRILSAKNMLLLEMIRNSKPGSVAELASLSGRKPSNLSRTLKAMEKIGVIEFEHVSKIKKAPRVAYDRFEIQGTLAA